MLVLAQVSSTKTRRRGSGRPWNFFHCSRRRAIFGRSCSAGRTLFFEAQTFGVSEAPDLNIVHLYATLGQLGHQPPQGEVSLGAIQQPVTQFTRQQPGLVATNLARSQTA
jgi:hypothetical protein